MPLLSICIATRNRAEFLGETLDNILSQATAEVEVVVVDGASTDGTERLVRERQARSAQLRYLRLPVNGGFDQDYDRAVEFARGDYCWLMSDDDLLKPGAVANVLQAISDNHDLVVVNFEVWNKDYTQRVLPIFQPLPEDRLYAPTDSQSLFAELGSLLTYIGAVIIKRRLWLGRDKASYFGTLFVHVGVIFQAPLAGSAFVIAQPQVATRYGNASWAARHFEIWMFKWPNLVWSFSAYTHAAKRQVIPREPWHNLKLLLMNRAIGVFSMKEYSRLLAPRLKSKRERWTMGLIARSPGVILNLAYMAYLSLLRQDGRFLLADLKNSRFYYRTYFRRPLAP
jgi:glycosyltransferase involved in cell wall biosynthesis